VPHQSVLPREEAEQRFHLSGREAGMNMPGIQGRANCSSLFFSL
jgi:puromycin-sensitive aminopeptidase